MTTIKYSRYFLTTLTCLLAGALSGCISLADPWASQLPATDDDNSVTLVARSIINPSDIQHEHILRVDGYLAAKFKHDEIKTFKISAAPHSLTLTCHSAITASRSDNNQWFNYNSASGKTKLAIDPKPKDELCLKISFSVTNCAVLEDADPSYCRR